MFMPEGSGQFDVLSGEWSSEDMPSRSKESKRDPIGHPAPIPAFDDRYVYVAMQRDGKKPVAYDPCRPIHYVTNTRTMPPDGLDLVSKAIAEASRATGLVFIDDGPTQEDPILNGRLTIPSSRVINGPGADFLDRSRRRSAPCRTNRWRGWEPAIGNFRPYGF